MKDTQNQFKKVVEQCTEIFTKKMMDYGVAWRIMRTTSVTDQIFIKANRIRSLQTKAERLVNEGIEPEFIGIINYSAMAIIQLRLGVVDKPDLEPEKAAELYMLIAHLPHVNTIHDDELKAVADAFGLTYREDFLNL